MNTYKMRSPTEAPQGVQRLQSRDAIPSTCYDSCNNANLEAQSVGMTPELCDSNSVFQSYRSACEDCLNAYMDEPTTRDYLDQNFGQWTDYCNAMAPLPTSVSVFTTISPSLVEETVVVTIPYTLTVFGVKTFVSLTKTLTSFPPLPDTTVIIIETVQDGHSTVWAFTKTFTHLRSDSLISLTSMSQNTSSFTAPQRTSESTAQVSKATASSPTNTMTSDNTQRSQAWVAGPVIGAVAGVAILLLVTWWLLRIKRKRDSKRKGNELHGESALKSELESKIPPQELDGQGQNRQPAELPSNSL